MRAGIDTRRGAVRTRFAPSPTGLLHVGSVRTALFNYLFARAHGGKLVLRIEDTDVERSSAAFEKAAIEDLEWLGLRWDEGPDNGDSGPYRQSERLDIYRRYADGLVQRGLAYRCWCTKERLEGLKRYQVSKGLPPRYDNRCRHIEAQDAPEGVAPVIRFKVPERVVRFADAVHGPLSFDSRVIGDFVIIGSDTIASYNFAVVVDDALMSITHIIRGDDHISNTPRQALLFEALGFAPPFYAHIPLVLSADRTPLGKRHESASIRSLRGEGFLPEAVLNTVARLGWQPAPGLLCLDEMASSFSLDKLSRSPSVFDIESLRRFNRLSIEGADPVRLIGLSGIGMEGADKERLREIVGLVRRNAATLNDMKRLLNPFTGEGMAVTEEARAILREPYAKAVVRAARAGVEGLDSIDEAAYDRVIKGVKEATGEKGRRLFMPIRCALTGDTEGIELVNVFRILGRERAIERLKCFEE
ncbi:MAG: glutamate--tRNA ligase [Deltaproteobacteria bacterium]|nr:glutamate--tRNA ligase [Deltaproteobacteria bacterium]